MVVFFGRDVLRVYREAMSLSPPLLTTSSEVEALSIPVALEEADIVSECLICFETIGKETFEKCNTCKITLHQECIQVEIYLITLLKY